jgi:AraC family transcriptional activator of pobA
MSGARFLFAQAGAAGPGQGAADHRHPFWQLELITAGRATARVEGAALALRRGSVLLLPPDVEHGFAYLASGTAWLSLKFSASGWRVPAAATLRQGEVTPIVAAIRELCSDGAPRPAAREALDHLLAALMAVVAVTAQAPATPSLAERVRELVERHDGRPWSVAQVARVLGGSPGHCSARFKAESGLSLKVFIDRCRAERAASLLTYSELSVAEVGERLGFADGFAFSRFFARVKRMSPTAFRDRARRS